MLKLKRIDNMDILSNNFDEMVKFYTETLGLKFFLPYEPGEGWAGIDFGNLTLYLFATEHQDMVFRRTGINEKDPAGFDSFAFEVEDLDEAHVFLKDKVQWVHDEITIWKHPSGRWYRYRPFFDPDGNMIYVTEPHAGEDE
ncbi:VOC family protein [Paeniglutamicibacter sp. NPDC091659]|uniref:VOC family protein n=1 Tax=Paeniglutamicibacter sp. NPDC091659 TaxID=3364389 RepID=UPI00380DE0CF